MTLSRRQVLRGLATVGSAMAVRPGALLAAGADSGPRVVVVGAGLAGLVAAYELHRAGQDVLLIEASHRPGGRLWTVRDRFADGLKAEMGAQTAGSGYKTLLSYLRHFDLGISPLAAEPGVSRQERDVLLSLRGQRLLLSELRADPSRWPLDLTDDERGMAPFGLLSRYLMPLAREIGATANVLESEHARYDRISLKKLLEMQGASAAAIELIEQPLNYNRTDTVSALSVLRDLCRRIAEQDGFEIRGGNDLLPRTFANQLSSIVSYAAALRRIERNERGFRLSIERRGTSEQIAADQVVLAIPFTVLRDIEIDPPLADVRMEMIRELPYTQVAKSYVQTRTRFWKTSGEAFTAAYTDTPMERVFDVSDPRVSDRGLLLNWINGDALAGQRSEAEISDEVVGHLSRLLPGAEREIEAVATTNWAEQYSKGAYAHYAPGQLTRFAPLIAQPIDGLHFAGEHTELVEPGMEGALVSGVRAAAAVAESLGKRN